MAESLTPPLQKIQVYTDIVVPTLLYNAETWVIDGEQIRLLKWFHKSCLHSILGTKWQDNLSNKDALNRANLLSIQSILIQVKLC